jgi:N-methylhydantoinase A
VLRVGIDTGGTFTDVVAFDEVSGGVITTKVPSTPADPSIGFIDAISKIGERGTFELGQIASVAHGTTVATNAVLSEEGSLPGLGLIVTRGFRHILEIARQTTGDLHAGGYGNSYFWVKPERIVPLQCVCEVTERLDFRGDVLTALNEADVLDAANWFRTANVSCIGVCLLHAYADGAHERRVRDILRSAYPEASVSISSEVLPEYREYERAVTTLVDAFVKPRVAHYVAQIDARLPEGLPFYIMKSNGGVVSAREAASQPINTLLSGPAAGALGAAMLASAAGVNKVLTLDGGGTSTDVAVLDSGAPHLSTEGRVGAYPVKVPMIDVVTVGAGGGSIARRAPDGRLKVGPASAGADPGPMCYGRGGTSPTVTDATLVLERIPPHLLGGEISLDPDLARAGVRQLAESIGLDSTRTALGVLEIAAWNQANAVRQVTVKRGLDVRDYVLVAFGGSGPLQAGRLVDLLGLKAALVPPDPGNVSAFGLLTVDVKNDYVVTQVQRDDALDFDRLNIAFERLEDQAVATLRAEGFNPGSEAVQLIRSADLRYFGQAWEVRIEVPAGLLDRQAADVAVERFHAAHRRTYGYSYADNPSQRIEWVNLRVSGLGPLRRPRILQRARQLAGGVDRAKTGVRQVHFDVGPLATSIYARTQLQPDDCVDGPAIVEEFGSTTVVLPGQRARVDDFGNLLLERCT